MVSVPQHPWCPHALVLQNGYLHHNCLSVFWSLVSRDYVSHLPFSSVWCAAIVVITPLDRDVSRQDIECPGDIIPYNCSIQSNSERVSLTWHVILPGETPITMTYQNNSINEANLNSYITTSLTGFRTDEFIHSTIEVTVQSDIPTDQIILACSIDELENDTAIVHINKSSKFNLPLQSCILHVWYNVAYLANYEGLDFLQTPFLLLISTSLESIMATWRPQLHWTGAHHRA